MKVVSIINYKGGVGKTTLTANLGAYAAMKGYRVLLIDLDPQTHLTFSFMTQEHWRDNCKDKKTLKNYFDSLIDDSREPVKMGSLVVPLELPQCRKLGLICSSLEMTDIDMKLASKCNGTDYSLLSGNSLRMFNYLRTGISELGAEYDLVLIDCPPNCNASVRNALVASDSYLIPARLDYLSSLGIENLTRSILKFLNDYREFKDARPDLKYESVNLKLLGVVPMMVWISRGTEPQKAQKVYLNLLKDKGLYIFQYVRNNNDIFGTELRDKLCNVVPAVLAHLKADNTKSRVMGEMRQLCEEFISRVGI